MRPKISLSRLTCAFLFLSTPSAQNTDPSLVSWDVSIPFGPARIQAFISRRWNHCRRPILLFPFDLDGTPDIIVFVASLVTSLKDDFKSHRITGTPRMIELGLRHINESRSWNTWLIIESI